MSDVQVTFDILWESTFQDSNPIPTMFGLKVKVVQALGSHQDEKCLALFLALFLIFMFLGRTGWK